MNCSTTSTHVVKCYSNSELQHKNDAMKRLFRFRSITRAVVAEAPTLWSGVELRVLCWGSWREMLVILIQSGITSGTSGCNPEGILS